MVSDDAREWETVEVSTKDGACYIGLYAGSVNDTYVVIGCALVYAMFITADARPDAAEECPAIYLPANLVRYL